MDQALAVECDSAAEQFVEIGEGLAKESSAFRRRPRVKVVLNRGSSRR